MKRTGELLDFVTIGNMRSFMNVLERAGRAADARQRPGAHAEPANVWDTNRVGGATTLNAPMVGIENQMQISLGNLTVSDAQWRSYSQSSGGGLGQTEEH